jgi:succinyl-CoA synthetase alpha subunit
MADYVDYLGDDERTKVIVLYIEGLKDGKRFLKSARAATARKPIIVFKAGRPLLEPLAKPPTRASRPGLPTDAAPPASASR